VNRSASLPLLVVMLHVSPWHVLREGHTCQCDCRMLVSSYDSVSWSGDVALEGASDILNNVDLVMIDGLTTLDGIVVQPSLTDFCTMRLKQLRHLIIHLANCLVQWCSRHALPVLTHTPFLGKSRTASTLCAQMHTHNSQLFVTELIPAIKKNHDQSEDMSHC